MKTRRTPAFSRLAFVLLMVFSVFWLSCCRSYSNPTFESEEAESSVVSETGLIYEEDSAELVLTDEEAISQATLIIDGVFLGFDDEQ